MSSASASPLPGPLARLLGAAALLAGLAATAAAADAPVRFEGNRALTPVQLRAAAADELARFSSQGGRGAAADDAAFRMTLAYRTQGYAFAAVGYRIEPAGPGSAVVFTVDEGPRVLLGKVSIAGAAAFPADRLRAFFPGASAGILDLSGAPPYVAGQVRSAAGALRDFYRDNGFLDAAVPPPRVTFREGRTRADVAVTVAEGPRYVVRETSFSGDLVPEAAGALRRLEGELAGKPFTGQTELTVRERVAGLYGDLGFPDAVVELRREAGPSPGDVLLRAAVAAGARVRIGGVEVAGNRRTRRGFVLRRVRLGAGDRYRRSAVEESVRELYATGLFSRVDLRLEGEGEERTLLVEVREVPARELSFTLGWSSYERLRAEASLEHLNVFGTGRSVGLEGGGSLRRTNVTVRVADPRFLGTPLVATVPVGYGRSEEPAFTRRLLEVAPQLSLQLTRDLAATLSYPLQYAWTGSISEEAPPELADENYRLARLSLQGRYDTRRELFFPTHGLEATVTGEVADDVLLSQLSFLRAVATIRGYVSLTGSTVLALRAESGLAVPTRDQVDLPLGERFFLGGERSVRSFGESRLGPRDEAGEPLGGLGYNLASAELRQRIAGNLSAAVFADVGNVSPNRGFAALLEAAAAGRLGRGEVVDATRRDFFSDFRAGVGIGVRYITPIGPARLDIAWNPDPREGEDRHATHLSIGMAF